MVYMESEKKKRTRQINFTAIEAEILVNLVAEYREQVENKKTDNATTTEKNRAWDIICQAFNSSDEIACFRDTKALRGKWEALKGATRKKTAEISRGTYKIDGEVGDGIQLTPLEEQICSIIENVSGYDPLMDCETKFGMFYTFQYQCLINGIYI